MLGLAGPHCRGLAPGLLALAKKNLGPRHEGDEGHVSELARSDWCMGSAPACGRFRIVVERKPEDAAESLSLKTNSRCMPTDLSI